MKSVFLSFVIPWQDFEVALNRGPILGSAGLSPGRRGRTACDSFAYEGVWLSFSLKTEDGIALLKMGFRIISPAYSEGCKESCPWKACDCKQELSSEAFRVMFAPASSVMRQVPGGHVAGQCFTHDTDKRQLVPKEEKRHQSLLGTWLDPGVDVCMGVCIAMYDMCRCLNMFLCIGWWNSC